MSGAPQATALLPLLRYTHQSLTKELGQDLRRRRPFEEGNAAEALQGQLEGEAMPGHDGPRERKGMHAPKGAMQFMREPPIRPSANGPSMSLMLASRIKIGTVGTALSLGPT